jgi:uncharacterized protein (DUF1684 family)
LKRLLLLLLICFPIAAITQSLKKEVKEHRKEYKADFLKEERSPFYNKKEELKLLRFFKPKKKYRVACTFTLTPESETFDMATYSGMLKKYRKYGTLEFTIKGQTHQLAVYQSLMLIKMDGYRDYLFLPFKDLTNDKSTYGGGRYINLKIGDIKDGKVTLDFNKNYNPYCAFSGGYNCPIPPKENHLGIAIKAGEKKFAGEAH